MSFTFKFWRRKKVFLLSLFLLLISCRPAFAGKVERVNKFVFDTVPLNIEEITESADRIFSGVCLKKEAIKNDPSGVSVIKYTFNIAEGIKGVKDKTTISFKQWASLGSDSTYTEGQKYLLFLYPDSRKGLTSPVGYLQGNFEVKKEVNSDNEIIKNKMGNIGLLRNVSTQKRVILEDENLHDYLDSSSEQGDFIRYKDFVRAVEYLVEKNK